MGKNNEYDDDASSVTGDIDEYEPMPEIDTEPTITDAYTEIQTKSHGITFILRNIYDKTKLNKNKNFYTLSQNSDAQVVFDFNETKKEFSSITYKKPFKKCNKIKYYNEISASEYKIKSKYDNKKIYVLLFYANKTLEDSSKFKRFVNEYIDKKFDVIMGFHNVDNEGTKFFDKSNKEEVFFFIPPIKDRNLLGLFTYSSPDNINVGRPLMNARDLLERLTSSSPDNINGGGKKNRLKRTMKKRIRKSNGKKQHKKYKNKTKNRTKKYRRN